MIYDDMLGIARVLFEPQVGYKQGVVPVLEKTCSFCRICSEVTGFNGTYSPSTTFHLGKFATSHVAAVHEFHNHRLQIHILSFTSNFNEHPSDV